MVFPSCFRRPRSGVRKLTRYALRAAAGQTIVGKGGQETDNEDGSGNYVFTSSAPHGIIVGNIVVLSGMANPSYNGQWTVATVPTTTTFTLDGVPFVGISTGTFTVLPPVAAFSVDDTTITTGTLSTITDASTGGATAWSVDWGDGTITTTQNPTHTYAAAGTYTVTQTVSNVGGSDQEIKIDYIVVSASVHTTPLTDAIGTFTWHVGSTNRSVICIGEGGSGDDATDANGGGGGEWSTMATVWAGNATGDYTIGLGGTAAATQFTNGADTCSALPGDRGRNGGAGGSGGTGDTTHPGGNGGAVNVAVLGGGGGGAGGSTGSGGNGVAGAGGGAGGVAGTGGTNSGAGGSGKLVTGDPGNIYGGGGGGGITAGGTGYAGVIQVSETY